MTELDMSLEELKAWKDRMIEYLDAHHSVCGEDFFRLERFVEDYKALQELRLS